MKVFSVYNPSNQLELLDVMTENYIDFEDAYNRKEEVKIGNTKIPIISIDDLIKLKEKAGRLRDTNYIKALKAIQELEDEKHDGRKK